MGPLLLSPGHLCPLTGLLTLFPLPPIHRAAPERALLGVQRHTATRRAEEDAEGS